MNLDLDEQIAGKSEISRRGRARVGAKLSSEWPRAPEACGLQASREGLEGWGRGGGGKREIDVVFQF